MNSGFKLNFKFNLKLSATGTAASDSLRLLEPVPVPLRPASAQLTRRLAVAPGPRPARRGDLRIPGQLARAKSRFRALSPILSRAGQPPHSRRERGTVPSHLLALATLQPHCQPEPSKVPLAVHWQVSVRPAEAEPASASEAFTGTASGLLVVIMFNLSLLVLLHVVPW